MIWSHPWRGAINHPKRGSIKSWRQLTFDLISLLGIVGSRPRNTLSYTANIYREHKGIVVGCEMKKNRRTCPITCELKQIYRPVSIHVSIHVYTCLYRHNMSASLQICWRGSFASQCAGHARMSRLIWCRLLPFCPFSRRNRSPPVMLLSHASSSESQSTWCDQVSRVYSGGLSSLRPPGQMSVQREATNPGIGFGLLLVGWWPVYPSRVTVALKFRLRKGHCKDKRAEMYRLE